MKEHKKNMGAKRLIVKATKLWEQAREPSVDPESGVFADCQQALHDALVALEKTSYKASDTSMLKALCGSELTFFKGLVDEAHGTWSQLCQTYVAPGPEAEEMRLSLKNKSRWHGSVVKIFDWSILAEKIQQRCCLTDLISELAVVKSDVKSILQIQDAVQDIARTLAAADPELVPQGVVAAYQKIRTTVNSLHAPPSEECQQSYRKFAEKFTVAQHAQQMYSSKLTAWKDRRHTHTQVLRGIVRFCKR